MTGLSRHVLEDFMHQTLEDLLERNFSMKKVEYLRHKHAQKDHFIPANYRIAGGLLQSLNIQFGNFIEELLQRLIKADPSLRRRSFANKRIECRYTEQSEQAIERFIRERSTSGAATNLSLEQFHEILREIVSFETNSKLKKQAKVTTDIDTMFLHNNTDVYVELKAVDDHDTTKIKGIYRKALTTYAGLISQLGCTEYTDLKVCVYYFQPIIKVNFNLMPREYVYHGASFFERYLSTSYEDVRLVLREFSQREDVKLKFDDFFLDVISGK